jgi:hypothetical protein
MGNRDWSKKSVLVVGNFVAVVSAAGVGVHWFLQKFDESGRTVEPWWVWAILLSAGLLFWLLITLKERIVELSERAR